MLFGQKVINEAAICDYFWLLESLSSSKRVLNLFFSKLSPLLFCVPLVIMVSTPSASSSTSRLSALKNARNSLNRSKQQCPKQTGIGDYLKRASPIPQHHQHQPQQRSQQTSSQSTTARHQSPMLSETQNSSAHSNKILDGVVACLDVRYCSLKDRFLNNSCNLYDFVEQKMAMMFPKTLSELYNQWVQR